MHAYETAREVISDEKANKYAKAAAEGGRPDRDASDYRWETSLFHMTRVAGHPSPVPNGRPVGC